MGKYKIFFSYTMKDKDISEELLKEVKDTFNKLDNVETYFDIFDNHSLNHQDYVYKSLNSSNLLCLIKSPDAPFSCWVKKELEEAKKIALPVVEIEKGDIKEILNTKTQEELLNNEKVKEILKAMKIETNIN